MTTHRKFDYDKEHISILKYLYEYRNKLPQLTYSKLIHKFNYSDPTFNRLFFYLYGAELINVTLIGNTNIYQITEKGIQYIKKKQ